VSPPGRPKGEPLPLGGTARSAEGAPIRPPGRPKGEHRSAQHEGGLFAPAWFSRQGEALTPAEESALADLLSAHPALAAVGTSVVAHWREAAAIVRAGEWDSVWWDVEEEERERLWVIAADRAGEQALFDAVTAVRDGLADTVGRAARAAAARGGLDDEDMVRAASGAALLTVQQASLAAMAGTGERHYFVHKRALFTAGRWPLGLVRGRYYVF